MERFTTGIASAPKDAARPVTAIEALQERFATLQAVLSKHSDNLERLADRAGGGRPSKGDSQNNPTPVPNGSIGELNMAIDRCLLLTDSISDQIDRLSAII